MLLAHTNCSINNNYEPKTGGFSEKYSLIRAYMKESDFWHPLPTSKFSFTFYSAVKYLTTLCVGVDIRVPDMRGSAEMHGHNSVNLSGP